MGRPTIRLRAATGAGVGSDALAVTDDALDRVAQRVPPGAADLTVVFLGAAHAPLADVVAARVADRLAPRCLIGVTAGGVVADGRELESPEGLSVWAAALPGAELTPLRYPPPTGDAGGQPEGTGAGADWPQIPDDAAGVLLFADPFTFPADGFCSWVDQARPGLPVSGGLASGARAPGRSRLLLDADVHADGAVAVALGGQVRLRHLVSQGCRPVGASYVVTAAERNLVRGLAGAPPMQRIREVFAQSDAGDRELMRQGLHIGVVIDEYREDHDRGDFLIRGVLGAEPETGAVAIGDVVPVGHTVRFHVRDAASADEDLRALLAGFDPGAGAGTAALLFTCNGRGRRLFGRGDHDAGLVRERLGDAAVSGFFCAGELGPVGGRSFLHGFTASLLVLQM